MAPLHALGVAHLINTPRRTEKVQPLTKEEKAALKHAPPKTSETDPIKVNWVPPVPGIAGSFGATICPGKQHDAGRDGRGWKRNLYLDLRRIRDVEHGEVLVPLVEGWELNWLKVGHLIPMAETLGLRVLWFPVKDQEVPEAPNLFSKFVDRVLGQAQQGKKVVVHCRGGIGRTGTLLACCLVANGMDPEAAILKVREARPNAVENPKQIKFVFDFAQDRKNHGIGEANV